MSDVNKQLLDALKSLFASYKQLADSGDAGNWRIEDYPEGKQALQAIAAAEQAQQAEPRCACGDSFTSDAVCVNCLLAQPPALSVQYLPADAKRYHALREAIVTAANGKKHPVEYAITAAMRESHAKTGSSAPDFDAIDHAIDEYIAAAQKGGAA